MKYEPRREACLGQLGHQLGELFAEMHLVGGAHLLQMLLSQLDQRREGRCRGVARRASLGRTVPALPNTAQPRLRHRVSGRKPRASWLHRVHARLHGQPVGYLQPDKGCRLACEKGCQVRAHREMEAVRLLQGKRGYRREGACRTLPEVHDNAL